MIMLRSYIMFFKLSGRLIMLIQNYTFPGLLPFYEGILIYKYVFFVEKQTIFYF